MVVLRPYEQHTPWVPGKRRQFRRPTPHDLPWPHLSSQNFRKRRGGDLSSTHFEGNWQLPDFYHIKSQKYIPRALKICLVIYFAWGCIGKGIINASCPYHPFPSCPVLASNQVAKGAGLASITNHHHSPGNQCMNTAHGSS